MTPTDQTPQWVEAIGSLIAALVALVTVLYFEILKPLLKRPKLEIYYDNNDSRCRRLSPSKPPEMSSYFIRLKIVNTGDEPAERCLGRLVTIADKNRVPRTDWDISSIAWPGQQIPEPIYLSPKGDYSFLDVAQVVEGESTFGLRVDSTPHAIKLNYEPGEYYFQIVVYAQKAAPVEQWFWVNWNGEFDKFIMKKTGKPTN